MTPPCPDLRCISSSVRPKPASFENPSWLWGREHRRVGSQVVRPRRAQAEWPGARAVCVVPRRSVAWSTGLQPGRRKGLVLDRGAPSCIGQWPRDTGAVYVPWWILTSGRATPAPVGWPAVAIMAVGAGLCLWCLWVFAIVGRGTPGPWSAPRRVVAVGPYRWVRNPIYIRGAPRRGRRGLAVPLAVTPRVRRGAGDRLPPVRDRLRGADTASQVRRDLCGVPAERPALDPAAASARIARYRRRPSPQRRRGHLGGCLIGPSSRTGACQSCRHRTVAAAVD